MTTFGGWWMVAWMVASATTVHANRNDEREILLELYAATGGNHWNRHSGWLEQTFEVCTWDGVTCNSNGKVVELNLQGNFAMGRTPVSLWNLPHLSKLAVSHNPQLTLNLQNVEQATELKELRMDDTATVDVTPLSLSSSQLTSLHMSDNRLNQVFPSELLELTLLEELHMANCHLKGTIPSELKHLNKLTQLNLFDNDLTGTIPHELYHLEFLRTLSLSYNRLTGTLPTQLNDLILLHHLFLEHNHLVGPLLHLQGIPGLTHVSLHNNQLTGTVPTSFLATTSQQASLSTQSVIHVDLSNNALTGTVPGTLDVLEDLPMDWNLVDNEFIDLDTGLCDNVNWNVSSCEQLLCPVGTYHRHGKAHGSGEVCEPCPSNPFMGSTACFDRDDRSILFQLYTETSGEDWYHRSNWGLGSHVCQWHGVTCYEEDDTTEERRGRVRTLNLANNNLVGTVPASIFRMHYLEELNLGQNSIVLPLVDSDQARHLHILRMGGTHTTDFTPMAFPHLRELHATGVPLPGGIPTSVFQLTSLKVLALADCDMSGSLQGLGALENLEELYLYQNHLDGTLNDLGSLRKLKVLSLAHNSLTGTLDHLLELTSLTAVSLTDQVSQGGGITGNLVQFGDLPLTSLLLGGNLVQGTIPVDLLNFPPAGMTIDFSDNLLTGTVPADLARFERLNLYLEGNFIEAIDERLCTLDDWMGGNVAYFGCNAILCPVGTAGGRQQYRNEACTPCPEVTSNWIGQTSCEGRVEVLTEQTILERLYQACDGPNWGSQSNWNSLLHVCDWHGISCNEHEMIVSISLGNNGLVGRVPTELYQLEHLQRLALYSNDIEVSFDGIENARELESLILDETNLFSLDGIGEARSLKELNVESAQLSGSLPQGLAALPHLERLVVSNNDLTGSIPVWIMAFRQLNSFLAANNQFSGPLNDFSDFSDLTYLDLSNNALTGTIPASFLGSVSSSEKAVVNLQSNALTGTLPGELKRIERLTINLSGNRIEGIDSSLCQGTEWNDLDVQAYGCDGILCPVGTSNSLGRQSSDDMECEPCEFAEYMGTIGCSESSAVSLSTMMALGSAALMGLLLL